MNINNRVIISNIYFGMNEMALAKKYCAEADQFSKAQKHARGQWNVDILKMYFLSAEGKYLELIAEQTRQLSMLPHPEIPDYYYPSAVNNLATTYLQLEDYQRAIPLFKRSIRYEDSTKVINFMPHAWNNLGLIYTATKQYDSSLYCFNQALQHFTTSPQYADVVSRIQCSLAQLHLSKDDLDSCKYYLDIVAIDNTDGVLSNAFIYFNNVKSEYLLKAGFSKEALDLVEHLEEEALRNNLIEYLPDIYQRKYSCYKNLGQFKEALLAFEKYQSSKDSLKGEDIKRAVFRKELEMAFDHDRNVLELNTKANMELQKEKTSNIFIMSGGVLGIILLSLGFWMLRNEQNKKLQFAELEKSNYEANMKALRSQLNPHFIQNSLAKLDSRILQGKGDSARKIIGDLSDLLRMILVNSNEHIVPLEDDLKAITAYLNLEQEKHDGKFKFEILVADEIDQENTLIPSLLIQPFLENAIIHGFQNASDNMLSVRILEEHETLVFEIADNGVGMKNPEKQTTKGLNQLHGYGTKLTQERLEVLQKSYNSKTSIEFSNLDPGTKVVVKIPLILKY